MPGTLHNIAELLGMIVLFLFVLVICYFTTRLVAGKQLQQKRAGNFEVIETFPISQSKYLQLVRMGEKYVVISITKDSVSFITELDKEEVCVLRKDTVTQTKSFKEILSNLTKKKES